MVPFGDPLKYIFANFFFTRKENNNTFWLQNEFKTQFGRLKREKIPKKGTFHKKSTFVVKKFFMWSGPGKTQKIWFLKIDKFDKKLKILKNEIFTKNHQTLKNHWKNRYNPVFVKNSDFSKILKNFKNWQKIVKNKKLIFFKK